VNFLFTTLWAIWSLQIFFKTPADVIHFSLGFIFLLFIIQNTSVSLLLLLILRLICAYNLKDS
jgi:hypothetical protein